MPLLTPSHLTKPRASSGLHTRAILAGDDAARDIDRVADDYGPGVNGFENDIDEIETEVFGGNAGVSRRIYQLSRRSSSSSEQRSRWSRP